MNAKKVMYEKMGASVVAALEKRQFSAEYCATAREAKAAALRLIEPGKTVGYGGSATVDALEIKEELRRKGQPMFDRDLAKDRAAHQTECKKALTADFFLMGSNAITEDGCLVNMDGTGNRVAALIYGPEKVIVLAGMNKIVTDVEAGIQRTRRLAAPMNAQRFPGKSPCRVTGTCGDCKSPDCICASLVVTRLCKIPGRIHVILIGEDMGM